MAKNQAIQEQRDREVFLRSGLWADPKWIQSHNFTGYLPEEILSVLDTVGYFRPSGQAGGVA